MAKGLVISRFRYDDSAADRIRDELGSCLAQLRALPGFVYRSVGGDVGDPSLWVLETRWRGVGSYRRALSSYEVKVAVVPLLANALDEPSAYEVVVGEGATEPNEPHPRVT